jgi:hypothetical protein
MSALPTGEVSVSLQKKSLDIRSAARVVEPAAGLRTARKQISPRIVWVIKKDRTVFNYRPLYIFED